VVASNGAVILRAYNKGSLVGAASNTDSAGHPAYAFIGVTEQDRLITSITLQGGGEGWTGDIQIQSAPPRLSAISTETVCPIRTGDRMAPMFPSSGIWLGTTATPCLAPKRWVFRSPASGLWGRTRESGSRLNL
jgi:hypothetical protein